MVPLKLLLIITSVCITLLISRIFFRSFFSPLGIYGSIWSLLIGLYHLGNISFYPLSTEGKIAVYGSFICFLLGAIVVGLFELIKSNNKKSKPKWELNKKQLEYAIWFSGLIGICGGLILLLTVVKIVGGLEKVIEQPWLMRLALYGKTGEEINVGPITYFTYFSNVNAILGGFYIAKYSRKFAPCYFGLIASIMKGLAWSGRTNIIVTILCYGFSFFLTKKTLLPKFIKFKIVIAIFTIIAGVFLLSNFILSFRASTVLEVEYEHIKEFSYIPKFAYPYYAYFVPNVVAFDIFLRNLFDGKYGYGINIFIPITKFLYKIGLLEKWPKIICFEFVSTPLEINTYTYLRPIYNDFGLIGCLVVPYIIGLSLSYLFINFFKKPNLAKMSVLVHGYVLLFFSFYKNMMCAISWWYSLIFAVTIAWLLQKRYEVTPNFWTCYKIHHRNR